MSLIEVNSTRKKAVTTNFFLRSEFVLVSAETVKDNTKCSFLFFSFMENTLFSHTIYLDYNFHSLYSWPSSLTDFQRHHVRFLSDQNSFKFMYCVLYLDGDFLALLGVYLQ